MVSRSVHYNVDHAIRQGNLVFGHGWLFHESQATARLSLVSDEFRMPLEFGNTRPDVGRAFPDFPLAASSGFFFYARLPSSLDTEGTFLLAEFADGGVMEISLGFTELTARRWPLVHAVLRRMWNLLRQGDFSALREKSGRYLRSWALSSNKTGQLAHRVHDRPVVLMIDHSLGGGTNLYRAACVADFHGRALDVLVVTFHPALLGYRVEHHPFNGVVRHYQLDRLDRMLDLVPRLRIQTIFYNNAVSFPNASSLPAILSAMAKATSAQLVLALHDFFPFCPSPHLIDSAGNYCGLPEDPEICRKCLSANTQSFVPVYGVRDIGSWRKEWREVISRAEKVYIFSQGMGQMLRQVFPEMDSRRLEYVPHSMDYFADHLPLSPLPRPVRIGVVGNITAIKGSGVVSDLAEVIHQSGRDDIDLLVIGTLHAPSRVSVRQTGPYRREELPKILAREGINVILFPSIGPETFSYVIQEMKQLELPIVAFDIGAQAEYLRDYEKGLVLALGTGGEALLERVLHFHHRVYAVGA